MRQILVVAGVIERHGKLLLAQRHPGGAEGGKWEFPGGKVESGEDPRAALRRELKEELGIETNAGQVLDVVSVIKNDLHLVLLYFASKLRSGEAQPLDCADVRWFEPCEIEGLDKPPADTRFWEIAKSSFITT